jgi:cyclophilin family peptidyl-prolyl cis-trans isomerase
MGTQKRERQKANRAAARARRDRRFKMTRWSKRGLRIGAVVLAAVAVVFFVSRGGNDDDSSTETTVPTTTDGGNVAPDGCPPVGGSDEQVREFDEAPPMCISTDKSYTAEVETSLGSFVIELDAENAPMTVNNFVTLARWRYFDGIIFHRVIEGFVIQGGDPTGTGTGGPGYRFADELPDAGAYELGSVAMANSGPDTNGSQFFVVSGPNGTTLPPDYSLFGKVTEGLDVVEAIQTVATGPGDKPLEDVTILSVTITES